MCKRQSRKENEQVLRLFCATESCKNHYSAPASRTEITDAFLSDDDFGSVALCVENSVLVQLQKIRVEFVCELKSPGHGQGHSNKLQSAAVCARF